MLFFYLINNYYEYNKLFSILKHKYICLRSWNFILIIKNVEDIPLMRQYYRTSDMLNLLEFFPEISPERNLTIINSEKDFYDNIELVKTLQANRVDS